MIFMTLKSRRTVEEIVTLCEVMSMEDDEPASEWHRGYIQAMQDVLLYIDRDGVVMLKIEKSEL